jgi:hypothetical protein
MELEHRQYLKEHYNNYETAQSGFIRNLDLSIMKMYEHIYRTYIDPNFILTIWCGNCRMDMVLRLYKHYEKVLKDDETMVQKTKWYSEEIKMTLNQQPKKRGRKPKTNG